MKKNTKKQLVAETKNKEALMQASTVQVDKTLNSLSVLGLQVQRNLGEIGLALQEKMAELQAVETSIALKQKALEDLHGTDAILLSLDELRAQHQKTLQEFALEIQEARVAQDELERDEQERRKRAEEEYEYHLEKARKVKEDAWQEQLRIRHRDEQLRQEAFDRSLFVSNEEFKRHEQEYKAALEKAASFDAEVKKEVTKEVAILTNALKRDYEHKAQLIDIQNKAVVDGLNAKIGGLEVAIHQRDIALTDLRAQLKIAQESQIQLAKDAVNAAAQKAAQADAMAVFTAVGGGNGARPPRS